jgi:hypothetical protein
VAVKEVAKDCKEGFNSLAILVAWEIRKHRNCCVFNGSNRNITVALQAVTYEVHSVVLGTSKWPRGASCEVVWEGFRTLVVILIALFSVCKFSVI